MHTADSAIAAWSKNCLGTIMGGRA
jgi:hypothetical protein